MATRRILADSAQRDCGLAAPNVCHHEPPVGGVAIQDVSHGAARLDRFVASAPRDDGAGVRVGLTRPLQLHAKRSKVGQIASGPLRAALVDRDR
jgi:hypothetical protein